MNVPTIDFENDQSKLNDWPADTLKATADKFKSAGCLWLKGLFDDGHLKTLLDKILGFGENLEDPTAQIYNQALEVGKRRMMIAIPFEAEFNDPHLYAHPILYRFLSEILGSNLILSGYGCVISLPHAPEQHIHQDHPPLWGTLIDDFVPPFAVTVMIPLVDLNEVNGTTRMWPGSHLMRYFDAMPVKPFNERAFSDPYANHGDCLITDYRLYHCGLANRSERIRPILYLTYSRPWFRDFVNYKKHRPLYITAKETKLIPQEYDHLVAHLREGIV